MELELTTHDLSKLCRICLRSGDWNLWLHKVDLNTTEANAESAEEEHIALYKLFRIFDGEMANMELASEMPLICAHCLEELSNCYRFYQSLLQAKAQIKELFNDALQAEARLKSEERKDLQTEEIAASDLEESISYEMFPHENDPEEQVDDEEFLEKPLAKSELEHKPLHKPKFLLDGGITKALAHNAVPLVDRKTNAALKRMAAATTTPSPTHSTKKGAHMHSQSPLYAPIEQNASLVVTKFVPAAAACLPQDANSEDVATMEMLSASNELRTMDYTAVEVSAANLSLVVNSDEDDELNVPILPSNYSSVVDHGSAPVYMCKYCPQAFAIPQYLMAHVRKAHACKFCTRAFHKTDDLHAHIRAEHRHHRCVICRRTLSSHSNLRAHIKRLHGLKLPPQVTLLDYRLTEDGMIEQAEVEPDAVLPGMMTDECAVEEGVIAEEQNWVGVMAEVTEPVEEVEYLSSAYDACIDES